MNHNQREEKKLAEQAVECLESSEGGELSGEDRQAFELGNLMRQTASIDLPESDPELRQHLLDHLDDAGAKKSVLPHTQSSGHARRIRAIAAALVLGIGAWSFYQLNPGALQIADYDGLKYQQGTGLLDDTPTSTSSENRMRSIPETGKVFEMGDVAIVQVRDEVPHKNSAQNYTVDAPPSETPTTGLPDSDDWYVKKERRKKYEAIRLKVKPSIFAAPENSVTLLNGQTSSVPDGGTVILGGVKRMSGSDGPVAVMSGGARHHRWRSVHHLPPGRGPGSPLLLPGVRTGARSPDPAVAHGGRLG